MKKLLSLFLVLSFCLTLLACTNEESSSVDSAISEIVSSTASIDTSEEESNVSNVSSESSEVSEEISETANSSDENSSETTNSSDENSSETSEDVEYAKGPALYKVSDEAGNIAWLFGSIHAGKDSFYPLPDYVMSAFQNSDALAVEFDVLAFEQDIEAAFEAMTLMVLKTSTIKDHVSDETYNEAVKLLEKHGIYDSMLDYYMPVFWESLISDLAFEDKEQYTEKGVDVTLIKEAYRLDKEVLDIESAAIQYGVMSSFSMELQELLLKEAIQSYKEGNYKEEVEKLMDAWEKGDLNKIEELTFTDDSTIEDQTEKALYKEYTQKMITNRNIFMTDYAENALESGKEIFICVGMGHIIGEDGMVDLLTEKGYTVSRIGG